MVSVPNIKVPLILWSSNWMPLHVNVVLNGNEILFIFLLLHLAKHNSYMKIRLLAKNIISSSNTFSKAYFLFSHRKLEATERRWVCYRTQKRGRKIEFLSKTNQSDYVWSRTLCSGVIAVTWNLIGDFFLFSMASFIPIFY